MLYDTLERLTLEARIENDGTILGKLELKKKKRKGTGYSIKPR